MMETLFRKCTRFKTCSTNNCPLHPDYPELYTDGDDPEPRCTLPKSYRLKVAENFAGVLKFGGLTSREYAAKMKWDNMTDEERTQIIERGKKSLVVVRSTHNIGSEGVSISEGLSE
jgi:hypothetical protein